ncbi:UNVERIFIED_CONTAM: hypothetical protein HDU68_007094 [Siphonaria sp. JEL0065]|nr:hypothetical protein HDU68_007094 [Siphonaria sp. JEL0065]
MPNPKTKQQRAVELVQKELSVLSALKKTSKSVLESLQSSTNASSDLKQSILQSSKRASPTRPTVNPPPLPIQISQPIVSVITPAPTVPSTTQTKQSLKRTSQPLLKHAPRKSPSQSPTRIPSRNSVIPTSRVIRHKPAHDFVTSTANRHSLTNLATTSSTGLTSRNKTKDAATTQRKLQESDARLMEATRRMEAEKMRMEELAAEVRRRKERRVQRVKDKKRAANQAALNSWLDPGDGIDDPNRDALNEEGVSLDFALDDLLVSVASQNLNIAAQSPPRGMIALYRNSRSPSPEHIQQSALKTNNNEDDEVILKLYGYSGTGIVPAVPKPTTWKLQTDQQITIFDIAPQYHGSNALKPHHLSDTMTVDNILPEQAYLDDNKDDETDLHAIIIENASPSRNLSPVRITHEVEIQTHISQPTRIVIPSRLASSVRKGKAKFERAKSLGNTGDSVFEPIDAIQLMADELLDDVLNAVANEIQTFSDEFVNQVIVAEFMNQ